MKRTQLFKAVLAAALLLAVPATAAPRLRYLALGDSYTIGTTVSEDKRWPNALVKLLGETQVSVEAAEIIAENGWSTADLLAGIAQKKPQGPYDLVTLMIGVNNQFRGGSQEAYRKDLVTLFAEARKLTGGDARRVVVLSIPDWGVMPFAKDRDRAAIAKDINAFNAVLRQETQRANAQYVDVTLTSRFAATNQELVGTDGLHHSASMHYVWARTAYPACRAILERKRP